MKLSRDHLNVVFAKTSAILKRCPILDLLGIYNFMPPRRFENRALDAIFSRNVRTCQSCIGPVKDRVALKPIASVNLGCSSIASAPPEQAAMTIDLPG